MDFAGTPPPDALEAPPASRAISFSELGAKQQSKAGDGFNDNTLASTSPWAYMIDAALFHLGCTISRRRDKIARRASLLIRRY